MKSEQELMERIEYLKDEQSEVWEAMIKCKNANRTRLVINLEEKHYAMELEIETLKSVLFDKKWLDYDDLFI